MLLLQENPSETLEKDWDKMNRTACGVIRSYLTQDIMYHVILKTTAKKIRQILESKYLMKSIENRLHLKKMLYHFKLKNRISIGVHTNNYMKLITGLAHVNEIIKDEDKALILLSSLPDEEYETFVLTLFNSKSSLSYNDVSVALVNHDVRRMDKTSSSNSIKVEALNVRGFCFNHRNGKRNVGKSKTRYRELRKKIVCFLQERRTFKD